MYISCGTCPNITFVKEQLNYHNSDLQAGHFRIIKQVLRYLKGIITLGIEQERHSASQQVRGKYGDLEVVGYIDSSYAGDLKDRKSVTRYCFFFGEAIITCCSK